MLRRDRIGFIFQAFNLVPTLTAIENITLPLTLAGRKPDQAWLRAGDRHRRSRQPRDSTDRRSCPAASSSASQWPVRWPAVRRSSSPTSRPATSTPGPAPRSCRSCAGRCASIGQTIVMVTHDPVAASYADRVVFLADGRIVDDMAGSDTRHGPRPHEAVRQQQAAMGADHVRTSPSRSSRPRSCGSLDDRPRRDARRGLHGRHARADRHHRQDVRRAVRRGVHRAPTPTCAAQPSRSQVGNDTPPIDASLRRHGRSSATASPLPTAVSGYAQLVDRRRQGDRRPRHRRPDPRRDAGSTTPSSTLRPRRGPRPQADDEIVIDKHSADRPALRASATPSPCSPRQGRTRSPSPASPRSATPTRSAARRRCCSPPPRPSSSSARAGQVDAIAVVAADGVSRDSRSRDRSPGSCPTDTEVLTGAELTEGGRRTSTKGMSFFNTFLLIFAGHRAVRRCVHHLQHLLDHRHPAPEGDGVAAGDRRKRQAGGALGA